MKLVFLVLHLYVLRCKDCGSLRQESRDVAAPKKSYTRQFAQYVMAFSKQMTIKAIADHLHVDWGVVKSIIKENLQKKLKVRSFRKVRYIAIDEIAVHKGHHYMTVVVDYETGQVLFTAEGKDHTCLAPFFLKLRRARASLKAVAMDMSDAYIKAVRKYWPKPVDIVHDHYHVVSNMNDVLDKVRREEQNKLDDKEGKKLFKGSRYLLLRGREKLEEMPEKQSHLDSLLSLNETLNKVYLLKEELRLFWKQGTKEQAKRFIETWIADARTITNKTVNTFANTIEKRIEGILSWYDSRITSGPLEGFNNKIKAFKRAAYGYRDMDFFGLRVLFLHETKFNLNGV